MDYRQIIPTTIDRVQPKDRSTINVHTPAEAPFHLSVPPCTNSSPTVESGDVFPMHVASSTLPYLLNQTHSSRNAHHEPHQNTSHPTGSNLQRSALPPLSFRGVAILEASQVVQHPIVHQRHLDDLPTNSTSCVIEKKVSHPSHVLEADTMCHPSILNRAETVPKQKDQTPHPNLNSHSEGPRVADTHPSSNQGSDPYLSIQCGKPYVGHKVWASLQPGFTGSNTNNLRSEHLHQINVKGPIRKRAISDLQGVSTVRSFSASECVKSSRLPSSRENPKVTEAMATSPPPSKRMAVEIGDVSCYRECASSSPVLRTARVIESEGEVSSVDLQAGIEENDRKRKTIWDERYQTQQSISGKLPMQVVPNLSEGSVNVKDKMDEVKDSSQDGITGTKSAPFTCAQCADRFETVEERQVHIKNVHRKKFGCSICLSRFARKYDLKKHTQIVHAKVRPFTCEICEHSFGQKHHLVRHKRALHMKERLFACSMCPSRFSREEHLQNHSRSVHGMWRPFMCPMCDAEFCERRALREHLGSVHCVKSSRTAIFAGWQPGSRSPPPDIVHLLQM